MSKQVQVSRGVLGAGAALLVVSLLAVGYLLGQRDSSPAVMATATPAALARPVTAATPQELDDRIGALEKRVAARQREVGQLRVPASATPARTVDGVVAARRTYFEKLDAIVGASAFSGSQSFAAQLLPQAMAGDQDELKRLLTRTEQARAEVAALKPPPECAEHQSMVVAQLQEAVGLLREVQAAQASGDAGPLRELASRAEASQGEAVRLQVLDRSLRGTP